MVTTLVAMETHSVTMVINRSNGSYITGVCNWYGHTNFPALLHVDCALAGTLMKEHNTREPWQQGRNFYDFGDENFRDIIEFLEKYTSERSEILTQCLSRQNGPVDINFVKIGRL